MTAPARADLDAALLLLSRLGITPPTWSARRRAGRRHPQGVHLVLEPDPRAVG
jgi:hypothetical protein